MKFLINSVPIFIILLLTIVFFIFNEVIPFLKEESEYNNKLNELFYNDENSIKTLPENLNPSKILLESTDELEELASIHNQSWSEVNEGIYQRCYWIAWNVLVSHNYNPGVSKLAMQVTDFGTTTQTTIPLKGTAGYVAYFKDGTNEIVHYEAYVWKPSDEKATIFTNTGRYNYDYLPTYTHRGKTVKDLSKLNEPKPFGENNIWGFKKYYFIPTQTIKIKL